MSKTMYAFDELKENSTIHLKGKGLIYNGVHFLNVECMYVNHTDFENKPVTHTINVVDTDNNGLGYVLMNENQILSLTEYGDEFEMKIKNNE